MRRRILFLDVDGVLNTSADEDPDFMNPKHLNILNELQEELGFEIVLSSTWRCIFDIETFNAKFLGFGSKVMVKDYTPKSFQLPDRHVGDGYYAYGGWSKRGDEIQAWLDEHELVPGENVSICIIDDMDAENFRSLSKYFVKTSMESGLHEGHRKWVREIFAKQEKI
jgi:hypothetical protein